MQTKHLLHKHGGRITTVHAVAHNTEDGLPTWFYICDVVWDDGSGQRKRWNVPAWALCVDGSKTEAVAEINKVSELMNEYLHKQGRWLKKPKQVRDYLVHWLPNRPSFELTI